MTPIEEVLNLLESTTIFTVPPHYERWESGFGSLDDVRKRLSELRVRFENRGGIPGWLSTDLAGMQSHLNAFVPLRDSFYNEFPNGGDSHAWSGREAAERQLAELQQEASNLKRSIRSHSADPHEASRRNQQILTYVFGVVFIVVLVGIAFLCPNPTPFQFVVFKVVLALAAAGVAAMIPGFIEFQIPKVLRAGGALAVFAIVFFKNPASLVTQKVEPNAIDLSTDTEVTLSVIVDIVKNKQNVTISFDNNCAADLPHILIDKGEFEGKDIPEFLDNVRQRAKGEAPAFHTVREANRRYEIKCP